MTSKTYLFVNPTLFIDSSYNGARLFGWNIVTSLLPFRTLGGSFILPVLNKNQYDPFSAPIVFQVHAVVNRFGVYSRFLFFH